MADVPISGLPYVLVTGTMQIPVNDSGTTKKILASDIFAASAPTYAAINSALGLPANSFVFSNGSSEVIGLSEWNIDPTTKFSNVNVTYQPDNLGFSPNAFYWNANVAPLQDSPTDSFKVMSINMNLDSTANGFNFGSGGYAGDLIQGGYNYQGNGSTYGRLGYVNFNSQIGNGTDPVTVNGLSGFSASVNVAANAGINGNTSGFNFNLNLDAAAVTGSDFFVSTVTDFSQLPVEVFGYQNFVGQPNISQIANNHNYNGLIIGPTVTTFDGNAGFFGATISPQITNLGTGGATMANLSPSITHLDYNVYGLNVYATSTDGTADYTAVNIATGDVNTSGVVKGIMITGDTSLTSMAIDATGHCNLGATFDLVSGQGQMYAHVIGGEIRVPNGTAITGTDSLGNNMAVTVNLGDATSSWTTATLVGLTTLGFVGQIVGDGDAFGAINFCLNGFSDAHTGHIDRVNNFMAAAIPTGAGGTMDEMVHYLATQPAGFVATDNWAFRAEDQGLQSFMPMLALGEMASKKVLNSSVGLELDSTTRAILVSRMDDAQEGALTAVNGMIIYNTDLQKFRCYENGAWRDL